MSTHYQVNRADFNFETINGDVVVIYDQNKGNRSVTNDIDSILKSIKSEVADIGHKRIIYRDSRGIFDGVQTDQYGKFIKFFSLNENVLEQALNKLNQNTE